MTNAVSQLAKNTLAFSLLTLLSRITGLLRVSVFAAVLGSGRFDDAYQLANTIPNIVYEFVIGGMLSAILIPLLVETQQRYGKDSAQAWRVANLLLGYVGLVLAAVSALAVLFSPTIVGLLTRFGKGVHAEQSRELATYFFRFFAPQMFFYGLNAVFMAILNSRGVFAITAAAPILNNVVVIVTLLLYWLGLVGITGLAVGTTLGIAAMAFCQIPWLLSLGWPARPQLSLRDPLLSSIFTLGLPVLGVGLANLIGTIVRSNILYTVGSGFTTYTFCFQLIMMPYGIIAVSIATVLYPVLAEHAAKAAKREFLATVVMGTRWTIFILLPVVVLLSTLAVPIVRVLFERGQFTYANTQFTARFLAVYALSIVPYSLVILASRGFYAQQDTWTPMWINILGVALSVVLMVGLYKSLSILCVPIAAAVTYVITTLLSYLILDRRFAVAGDLGGLWSVWKMIAAAGIMALAVSGASKLHVSPAIVIESGERFPGHVSARYDGGAVLTLHTSEELSAFWKLIARDDTPPPPIDFRKARVAVVFAPRGSTTASLALSRVVLDSDRRRGELLVRIHKHGHPAPTALEEPAYLVAVIHAPVDQLTARFEISAEALRRTWLATLQLEELIRLMLGTIVGLLTYSAASVTLHIPEFQSILGKITRRLGRTTD
ncbi:MAG: murein biosynthesis integral membrane protein MurJ [Candidatus Sumerlaeaceae bacterium]